jgi:hypothetical protein
MSRPSRGVAASALLVSAILAAGLLYVDQGGSSAAHPPRTSAPVEAPAPAPPEGRARDAIRRTRLAARLQRGVDEAADEGGTAEAAIMLDDWNEPVIAGSEEHGETRFMRLWSMSKMATMVAALRALGWGQRPGRPISPELDAALNGAITRSENCRQHRVVLELQRLTGGIGAAGEAFQQVFRDAGAEVRVAT